MQYENDTSQNLNTLQKKLIPLNRASTFTNTMKKTTYLFHFFHLCLNNIWAQDPRRVCMTWSSSFSSLCRPEIHFMEEQGPQWAGTIFDSSISIQKTTSAVNRVEHQKTVKIAKNLQKRNNRLSEVIRESLITTYKNKRQKDAQPWQVKL